MLPTHSAAQPPVLIAQNGPHKLTAINDFLLDDALFYSTLVRHPQSAKEYACFSLSRGGFILLDPITGEKRQIRGPKLFSTAWKVAQSPEGDLFQADFTSSQAIITRWDWTTDQSQAVGVTSSHSPFSLQAGANGDIYILDYTKNHIHLFNYKSGQTRILADLKGIGHHVRFIHLAPDGMLYAKSIAYADQPNPGEYLAMINPQSGQVTPIPLPNSRSFHFEATGDGKVVVGTQSFGRTVWQELIRGSLSPIDQSTLRLTSNNTSLVFADGSFIIDAREWQCTLVSPDGSRKTLDIKPQGSPLRIFSVGAGAGKVWAGTFIPLRLGSYDPASQTTAFYGNPTPVTGEIYALAGTSSQVYFSSYTQAWITRLSPNQPLVTDQSLLANPGQLGQIKPGPLPLHRTYGVTQDTRSRTFFAALGGYGCPDSGIARIDHADGDQLATWIYPNTTFGAMVHLASTNQLLVSEYRKGEPGARFTLINPDTGAIEWSLPMLQDASNVVSWLADPTGRYAIGIHAYRATLLKFDVHTKSITHTLPEVRVGTHCHNTLITGSDGLVWGYTNQKVFRTDWDLTAIETVFDLGPEAYPNHYRFGICKGPDGCLYFPDGTRLMRIESH